MGNIWHGVGDFILFVKSMAEIMLRERTCRYPSIIIDILNHQQDFSDSNRKTTANDSIREISLV